MSRPTHYAVKAKDPCPDGRYAFHLTASRILDSEIAPPYGTPPMVITDDMSPEQAKYWRRHNPVLQVLQNAFVASAKQQLLSVGVAASSLQEPLSPTFIKVIDGMVAGEQCMFLFCRSDEQSKQSIKQFEEPHITIQVAAHIRKGGSKAAAVYLNDGINRSSTIPGLSFNHIYRAYKRFCRPGSLARRRAYIGVILAGILNRFAVLDSIYDEARCHPDYQGLRGSALAEAIHAHCDLHEVYHRAEARLDRRGLLMGPNDLAA